LRFYLSLPWRSFTLLVPGLALVIGCSDPAEPHFPDPGGTEWASDIGGLLQRVDRARFLANIQILAGFGDRRQGTESNLAAGNWIEQELAAYGYQVQRHTFLYEGKPADNIYATKVGTAHPDSMYIVSAHFDGRGGGGAADDDASGSALVMEIARVFAGADVQTERSVRFILWNTEEVGLVGARAYVEDLAPLRGVEEPPGSGQYPEPAWLGVIQHDMILFDHGLPPQTLQSPQADVDVEYQIESTFPSRSSALAELLREANEAFGLSYPAQVGSNMRNTDSWAFIDHTASVSLRENRRVDEIGQGTNPHWHQTTDVFETFSNADFDLGTSSRS